MRARHQLQRLCFTLALSSLPILTSNCGLDEIANQYIDVKIISNFSSPSYIDESESCNSDWFEPRTANFTLKAVSLSILDTDTGEREVLELLKDDSTVFKVTNRVQKIFSQIIDKNELNTDLIGKTIEALQVTFADEIVAQTKYNSSLTTTLGTSPSGGEDICSYESLSSCAETDADGECSITFAEPINIIQAQGYSFLINVNWKRTVQRDSSSSPPTDSKMLSPSLAITAKRT